MCVIFERFLVYRKNAFCSLFFLKIMVVQQDQKIRLLQLFQKSRSLIRTNFSVETLMVFSFSVKHACLGKVVWFFNNGPKILLANHIQYKISPECLHCLTSVLSIISVLSNFSPLVSSLEHTK